MATKDQDTSVMVAILGATATGKTRLAAVLANRLGGEIISADSRQVYRGMDLGTGKDYADYIVDGKRVTYHLVDIAEPGHEYSLFEFRKDFLDAWKTITGAGKTPVLCGGSGMYLESVLSGYEMTEVPENLLLRKNLETTSQEELNRMLASYRPIHNMTDTTDRRRTIRAIEIEVFRKENPRIVHSFPQFKCKTFGISLERELIRQRITERLQRRLKEGMIDEVRNLLDKELKPNQLRFYGLEYRYITDHVTGILSYDEMFRLLNTAIHQFAKRQMTWFRRMEKKGIQIQWIDGMLPMDQKLDIILHSLNEGR